uniref:Uncharacterized protein n=1 Tax=Amphimedon queenslandica TaxID=400682 RepID=A0A1X7VN86_AMPQE
MKLAVIALVLFVAVANAQPQQRRCLYTPNGWTGYYRETNFDAGPGDISYRFAAVSYDAIRERIKIEEREEREGERPERIFKLYFYNEKIEYRVERDLCTKREINETFYHYGVLTSAQYYGNDFLGAEVGGLGVEVDQFGEQFESGGRYFASYAPIGTSEFQCVPLLEAFVNLRGPYSEQYNVHYEFLNITAVTTWPPGAFDIPTSCVGSAS